MQLSNREGVNTFGQVGRGTGSPVYANGHKDGYGNPRPPATPENRHFEQDLFHKIFHWRPPKAKSFSIVSFKRSNYGRSAGSITAPYAVIKVVYYSTYSEGKYPIFATRDAGHWHPNDRLMKEHRKKLAKELGCNLNKSKD